MKFKKFYYNFLKTFNKKEIKLISKYRFVTKIFKTNLPKKQIIKNSNISINEYYNWTKRGTQPLPAQVLKIAEKRNYFSNRFLEKNLEWIAYLVGYNLGDGHISKDFCHTWFYGVNSDLNKIKNILLYFNLKPTIYTYKINNGKMAVNDRSFSRFLISFGAIKGDKTKTDYNVPDWIMRSKKRSVLKKRFLQSLCDAELSKLSKLKNNRFAFQSLKYYMVKEETHTISGKFFLDQLRNLFLEFGITSTKVKKNRIYNRSRDNAKMIQLYFIIHSNYINLSNFLRNIGFLYNSKRLVNKNMINRIEKHAEIEIQKIVVYKKAMILRKKGLSAYRIAKLLNHPISELKNWIYGQHKPRLFNSNQS